MTRSLLALAASLIGASACGRPAGSDGETASATETSASTGESGETGDETGELGCASEPPLLPESTADPVPWQPLAELDIADDGSTVRVSLYVPADQRYAAIRTYPLDGDPNDNWQVCHDLLEAYFVDAGISLIPEPDADRLPTDQRRWPGPGAGVFVFSNTLEPLPFDFGDQLELRFQMRHCVTGSAASRAFFPAMATRIAVEAAFEPSSEPLPVEPSSRLAVRMLVAEDSGWGLPSDDPELAASWDVAVERFAAVGIELELEAVGSLPPTAELRYDATMRTFRPLHDQVLACLRRDADDERFVPVVALPCLRREQQGSLSTNLGQTPHIPGALDETTAPSLVAWASGDCNTQGMPGYDSTRLGLVLAHEIGHYLGLHHSNAGGLGDHLDTGPENALMDAALVTEVDPANAWFSAEQATVMRRHLDVVPIR